MNELRQYTVVDRVRALVIRVYSVLPLSLEIGVYAPHVYYKIVLKVSLILCFYSLVKKQ